MNLNQASGLRAALALTLGPKNATLLFINLARQISIYGS